MGHQPEHKASFFFKSDRSPLTKIDCAIKVKPVKMLSVKRKICVMFIRCVMSVRFVSALCQCVMLVRYVSETGQCVMSVRNISALCQCVMSVPNVSVLCQ